MFSVNDRICQNNNMLEEFIQGSWEIFLDTNLPFGPMILSICDCISHFKFYTSLLLSLKRKTCPLNILNPSLEIVLKESLISFNKSKNSSSSWLTVLVKVTISSTISNGWFLSMHIHMKSFKMNSSKICCTKKVVYLLLKWILFSIPNYSPCELSRNPSFPSLKELEYSYHLSLPFHKQPKLFFLSWILNCKEIQNFIEGWGSRSNLT